MPYNITNGEEELNLNFEVIMNDVLSIVLALAKLELLVHGIR